MPIITTKNTSVTDNTTAVFLTTLPKDGQVTFLSSLNAPLIFDVPFLFSFFDFHDDSVVF